MQGNNDLREQLAEYAHGSWSGWMKYMFGKGERRGQFKVGSEGEIEIVWIMPPWAVERWQRQMNTPFSALPEPEKESDRAEADKMLAIVAQPIATDEVREAISHWAEYVDDSILYLWVTKETAAKFREELTLLRAWLESGEDTKEKT